MTRIPVGVLGASGYAGRELCQLIARHPALELAFATANDQRGARARLGGRDVVFVATEDAPLGSAELVFSALPHGASKEWVARAHEAGARVIDLSSDLRPGNGCGDGIAYGLTEVMRGSVRDAEIVANPGCYATAILLALVPLVERDLIASDSTVVVSAASGVTGAGNSPKRELLFAEVAEDFRAYAVGNVHRHLAEIRSTLGAFSPAAIAGGRAEGDGGDFDLVFTPHLLPVARGILATMAVVLSDDTLVTGGDAMQPWREAYGAEPFVELAGETPSIRDVAHRNVVRIFATAAAGVRRPTLLVHSAIDNLVKGAAGQAVQNANVMLGLDETAGLPA